MNKRRVAFLIAKITFAAIVIAWLFHKVDASRVWSKVRHAALLPVFGGILLMLATIAIAGWRWRRLLGIFGVGIPLKSLICIAQIGQFFTMFLPGPTGDDLTRMLYISRLAPGHVGEACTSVLFDRLIGLASVLGLALCCIPAQWPLLAATRQTYWLAIAMLIAGGAVTAMGTAFFVSSEREANRFFGAFLRFLPKTRLQGELVRMTGMLCSNKTAIAQVTGAAIGTQLLLCLVYWLAGVAIGVPAGLSIWFSFVPIVIAANAFPVTVAGIGVREYLLVLFLGVLVQVERETALAASLVVLGMTLAVCLLGGIVYIVYRPKHPTPDIS
jgi:uncharacterized membrane protein YbhN (UPF0104 family)